ncbi:MAG: hypothetical protein V4541_12685 [Bacteroidota bacterium]
MILKNKTINSTLFLTLLLITGYAQTPYRTKLDQFFDRLAEKNKAMGTLTIERDNKVPYTRSIGYSKIKIESAGIEIEFDSSKKQMTLKRNSGERIFTKEN